MNASFYNSEKKPIHVSYPVFKKSIQGLETRYGGVPKIIGKHTFRETSPTAQGLIVTALKRLGLISPDGEPTQELVDLAYSTNEDKWSENLAQVLARHYPEEIDMLRSGQQDCLGDILAQNYMGSTRRKAIRFFMMAADDAGFSIGNQSRISVQANSTDPISSGSGKKRVSRKNQSMSSSNSQNNQDTWTVTLGDDCHHAGSLLIPRIVDFDDAELVHAILEVARLYKEKTKGGQ